MASNASSISYLAGAANGKRATFLREEEERAASLYAKQRRGRDFSDKTGRPKRQSRFSAPADFSRPSPLVERLSSGNTRPFHIDVTTVSRPVAPSLSADGSDGGRSTSPGSDHAKYIERDGAVEPGAEEAYEDYLGRPGALEQHGLAMLFDDDERIAALPGVPELDGLGAAPLVGGELSVVSNISDDPGERKEFWNLVQEHERKTHTASLVADPSQAPRWWEALVANRGLDRELHAHLVAECDRYANMRATGLKARFRPRAFNVPVEKAASYLRALQYVDGGREAPPVKVKTRAGRVQKRLVIEFPYQATSEHRLEMLRNIGRRLERVEQDENGRWVGWMYTGVIHAPDGRNDARNVHGHIIAYDRPCRYLAEHAGWDFAVRETYEHRGELRTRYPHRQPKLACVSQSGRAKDRLGRSLAGRPEVGRNYIKHLRGQVADAINEVLERHGYPLRFHPGTNKDCGIDRAGTRHLGGDHKAEQIGVATSTGNFNAEIIWADEERIVRSRQEASWKPVAALLAQADDALLRTRPTPARTELLLLRHKVAESASALHADRLALDLDEFADRRGRSRAEVVKSHCTEELRGRARGFKRSATDTAGLQARLAEAEDFLTRLDASTRIERDRLHELGRVLRSAEARLQGDLTELQSLSDRVIAEVDVQPSTTLDTGRSERHQPTAPAPVPVPVPVPAAVPTPAAALAPAPAPAAPPIVAVVGPSPNPNAFSHGEAVREPKVMSPTDRPVPVTRPDKRSSTTPDPLPLAQPGAEGQDHASLDRVPSKRNKAELERSPEDEERSAAVAQGAQSIPIAIIPPAPKRKNPNRVRIRAEVKDFLDEVARSQVPIIRIDHLNGSRFEVAGLAELAGGEPYNKRELGVIHARLSGLYSFQQRGKRRTDARHAPQTPQAPQGADASSSGIEAEVWAAEPYAQKSKAGAAIQKLRRMHQKQASDDHRLQQGSDDRELLQEAATQTGDQNLGTATQSSGIFTSISNELSRAETELLLADQARRLQSKRSGR